MNPACLRRLTLAALLSATLTLAGTATAQNIDTALHKARASVVLDGLAQPWGMTWLPDGGMLITESRSGLICANAGIDATNVEGERRVSLLPIDADASARRIRAELAGLSGVQLAVLITDSFGRPWRLGQSEIAIGCAGLEPLDDWRGRSDSQGRELGATAIATGDQIAAAADLARDKVAGLPVVVARGLGLQIGPDGPGAASMQRPEEDDLFR